MLIKKVCATLFCTLVHCANSTIKAVAVRKHLERNRKDKDSKFRLILIESRIHRLSRYYKTVGVLPPTWRYESATASTLVA
jgi:small subunit ribosomal protein S13e